jgi:hypothetical protein
MITFGQTLPATSLEHTVLTGCVEKTFALFRTTTPHFTYIQPQSGRNPSHPIDLNVNKAVVMLARIVDIRIPRGTQLKREADNCFDIIPRWRMCRVISKLNCLLSLCVNCFQKLPTDTYLSVTLNFIVYRIQRQSTSCAHALQRHEAENSFMLRDFNAGVSNKPVTFYRIFGSFNLCFTIYFTIYTHMTFHMAI